MLVSSYDEIAACAAAYQRAMADSKGAQDVAAAEAVLRARVNLAGCLVAAGWTPSPALRAQLDTDRDLLLQPSGAWETRESALTSSGG